MDIKKVATSEIHWSIGWNASQQANNRLREVLGDTSKYFALLKVGNATYNWVVDTAAQWLPMGMAPDSEKALIMERTEAIKQEVYAKLQADDNLAGKICQVPNYDEYIFYRHTADGAIDVVITGWGFHNFKKAGPFKDTWPPRPQMFQTSIAFVANGVRQPNRPFRILTPHMAKPDTTNEEGLRSFREYPGAALSVIDDATGRRFDFVTTNADTLLEFDVTEVPIVEQPPVQPEQPPMPVIVRLTALDAQGMPLRGAAFSLEQGQRHLGGTLDDQGQTHFERDTFMLQQPLQCLITPLGQQKPQPAQFVLDASETDYVLQLKAPAAGSRLLEVLAALLLLATLAALLVFVFQPGIEALTKWIN